MSKIADAILTVEELFERAQCEYTFWSGIMRANGFSEDNAIAAAQYYGQMCALAEVNKKLLGDEKLSKIIADMDTKLYRIDFKEGS